MGGLTDWLAAWHSDDEETVGLSDIRTKDSHGDEGLLAARPPAWLGIPARENEVGTQRLADAAIVALLGSGSQ